MRSTQIVLACGMFLVVVAAAAAQQVTIGTPMNTVGDSFFERIGTNWGFNWKGANVSFGGPNMAMPQFGGFDPNAGLNSGFGTNGRGLIGFFNWSAGQGYRQNFTTQSPSVTIMNGQRGFFSDTSQSPFVIGQIPIVGGFPFAPYGNPMPAQARFSQAGPQGNHRVQQLRQQMAQRERAAAGDAARAIEQAVARRAAAPKPPRREAPGDLDLAGDDPPVEPAAKVAVAQSSSASRAVPSVAEARRLHETEKAANSEEAMAFFERGRTAEEDGKPGVAKIYYRMALKRAGDELRQQVQARLDAIASPGNP